MGEGSAAGRGGGWVVAQFALMAAIAVAWMLTPRWPSGMQVALAVAGSVLGLGGVAFAVWSARTLGRALTPFPKPAAGGALSVAGPYRFVRHPIYLGGLAFFVGASLWAGPAPLALTGALAVLWALKARVEEEHLAAAYPAYADYASRVRYRLMPFVH